MFFATVDRIPVLSDFTKQQKTKQGQMTYQPGLTSI